MLGALRNSQEVLMYQACVVDIIETEFLKRKNANSSYSLRAFAKNLGISPAVLSQVLNRKRDLTPKILKTIAPKINLDDEKLDRYLKSLQKLKKEKNIKSVEKEFKRKLDVDTFAVISQWYHYVILELFYLDDFQNDPHWIAKKINVDIKDVKQAIENLKSVHLLKVENDELVPTDYYTLLDDFQYTSKAMRERQKQILNLSALKIDQLNIDVRDHSSITISVDPALIPEIKNKIKVFRRSLGNFISKKSNKNVAVYEILMSFFPVTEF